MQLITSKTCLLLRVRVGNLKLLKIWIGVSAKDSFIVDLAEVIPP